MSTGLFQDEEDGYNLEETKYKLKLNNPTADAGGLEDLEGAEGDDLGDLEDFGGEGADDKPFDDEPFDAGVEADEDEDPKKFIQQLAGKLGQSLRQYAKDQGGPDLELEKFAVNSVLSATHTAEMDKEDQKDIIDKVKNSGKGEVADVDVNIDAGDEDVDVDVNKQDADDEDVTEESLDLGISKHNPNDLADDDIRRYYDATVTRKSDGLTGKVVRWDDGKLRVKITDGPHSGKIFLAYPSEVEMLNSDLGENYMMIQNLKNMRDDVDKILSMDKDKLKRKLKGHEWAYDHISSSQDDTEEVSDFLTTEEGEDILDEKKDDRCTRIAKRKYDTWPSAYASGAVVKCRQGKIWKNESVDSESLMENTEYEDSLTTEEKEGLHKWFSRQGGEGSPSGWVDCNTCRDVDGKTKCKSCGRKKGEKRAKYPACRPTPSACKSKGKGKKWGKKSESVEEFIVNILSEGENIFEAEYQGKKVKLNKPMRGDVKKYKVYVKNNKGNVVKVNFGDKNMEIKRDDPERRKSFRARHNCDNPGPKWKARYWSCKFWSSKNVSSLLAAGYEPKGLETNEDFRIFVPKTDMENRIKKALEENFNNRNEEPLTKPKPKTKPEVKPAEQPTRRQKPWRVRPNVSPQPKGDIVEDRVEGYNGKILKTLHLDNDGARLELNLDGQRVEVKFENTDEWTIKPMDYDEPWVYTYESVDAPDGRKYVVGVEFFGTPDTNLDIAGLHDDYVEEV